MFSHTLDCGAMKVWNLSVAVACAKPDSAGAPSTVATAPDLRRERRLIMAMVSN